MFISIPVALLAITLGLVTLVWLCISYGGHEETCEHESTIIYRTPSIDHSENKLIYTNCITKLDQSEIDAHKIAATFFDDYEIKTIVDMQAGEIRTLIVGGSNNEIN